MANDDGFDAEFSFIWRIQNFSYISPLRVLESPTFTVKSMDKTRWHLSIRITSLEYKYISCILSRARFDGGPEIMRVAFEFSFLDCNGTQLVKENGEYSFKRYYSSYVTCLVEQDEVLMNKKNEYLPDDTLTACCRMRRVGIPTQISESCFLTSVIDVEQCSFEWNVDNFSEIQPGMIRTIRQSNPLINVELSLTPKPEEALQFQILQLPENYKKINCEISVLNAVKETVYSKKVSRQARGNIWKFPMFLKKKQLTAKKDVCLLKDILALKFDISFSLGVISNGISDDKNRTYSLKYEESPAVEECTSTEDEAVSSSKVSIGDPKTKADKVLNIDGKSIKEISEYLSSPVNESFSPTQNEECPSIENKQISSVKNSTEDLKKDTQNNFNFKGNIKEILDKFSREDSFLHSNENISPYRNEESSSTASESISLNETEESFSPENENFPPYEIEECSSHANESFPPCENEKNEESSSSEDENAGEFDEFDNNTLNIEESVSVINKRYDLQRFYQVGTFSDIKLTVGNEDFLAHRLILSLKSIKFKEIFMSDLLKKSIKITDLDAETLRDLLIFAYTNNVKNITWKKAEKLYWAAEAYKMTSLKNACLMFFKENINESNACNILILADKHQDEELKQAALKFFVNHGKAIVKTEIWDEMKKNHIKLAFETMQQMFLYDS